MNIDDFDLSAAITYNFFLTFYPAHKIGLFMKDNYQRCSLTTKHDVTSHDFVAKNTHTRQ